MEVSIDVAAILKVRDTEGTVHEIYALQGKSAYQYAVEGGYTGTEAEFAAKLAAEIPTDSHINGLIDARLGVIENGAY